MATAILKGGPAIKRKAAAKKPAAKKPTAKKAVAKKAPSPRATIAVPAGKMADLMDQVRSAAGIGAKPGEDGFVDSAPFEKKTEPGGRTKYEFGEETVVFKDDSVKQPETPESKTGRGFTSQTFTPIEETGFILATPSGGDYATKPSLPTKPAEPKPVCVPPKPQVTNTFVSGMGTTFRLR